MSELRQDRATGRWVIIAPERGGRPQDARSGSASPRLALPYDPSCPFCPGNEHFLPGIIHEIPTGGSPGWCVRVVPNKYPALRPQGGPMPEAVALRTAAAGFGYHEVIIETARHDADLSTLSDLELQAVVRTYQHRFSELAAKPGIKSVLVFRNHGARGGASLRHPHSQVIAMAMVPPRFVAAAARGHEEFNRTGRCATCVELHEELADGRRVVEATERFVVLVPFAAGGPFELTITPRQHQASFGQADGRDRAALGELLRGSLRRLNALLADPPYNYVIESALTGDADPADSHWRLRIVPQLVTLGGFELASGLSINPSLPERDAEALRGAATPSDKAPA